MGRKMCPVCLLLCLSLTLMSCAGTQTSQRRITEADRDTIRVGILLSTTGTSAVVERSMLNAAYLAFDEINQNGGIEGKKVQYFQEDYNSNPSIAEDKIENLIVKDKVVATIGCYTSASRKATFPILDRYNSLLIYPTYTEGEEINPHVIYTGAMPNQQAMEYLPWMIKNHGKRVYLIGNDYVFPVTCNKQAKRIVEMNKGTVCGETYVPIGTCEFEDTLKQIMRTKPSFIYCDLVGDSLVSFFKAYNKLGIRSEECPIATIAMDEMSLQAMGAACAEGHYASMNYFSSLDTPESRVFAQKYAQYSHDGSVLTSLAEATYDSCYLLANALRKIKDPYDTDKLIQAFSGLKFDAPQGVIQVDQSNHCTWLYSRFAVVHNKSFQIVYESKNAIAPEPWPAILYPNRKQS